MKFELFWSGFEYGDEKSEAFGWTFRIDKDYTNNKGYYLRYIYKVYGVEPIMIEEIYVESRAAKMAANKFVICLMNMMNRECQ